MKRKLIIAAALSTIVACAAPALSAKAALYPACTIYKSTAQVPVSANCEPYYVNGQLVFDAISVNEGH